MNLHGDIIGSRGRPHPLFRGCDIGIFTGMFPALSSVEPLMPGKKRIHPPGRREDVFRPFFRLDAARNQDEGGTGLGLAIARDIARSHGGDITLGDSKAGGLRATVRVPV